MGGDCQRCGALRIDSQLGLERTPEEYVTNMVAVFREVWRVLKPDGTIWVNLGDSYSSGSSNPSPKHVCDNVGMNRRVESLAPKNLCGIPWRVAFALQADGWYLRSDIIWAKPNPMPESVTDRPTKSHEYVFLLSKQEKYYYDADAIKEPVSWSSVERLSQPTLEDQTGSTRAHAGGKTNGNMKAVGNLTSRNRRTVWTISTQPYPGSHYATFPEKLVEPCILAGSRPGDIVFDPFVGSGTVIRVATRYQRKGVGIDINFKYLGEQADKRMRNVQVEMQYA